MNRPSFSPQVLAALDFSRRLAESVQASDDPVGSAREFYERMAGMAGEPEPVFRVEDCLIDGPEARIPIRIYRPSDRSLLPVTLYFHGGWFFAGGLETHDRPLRALANAAECVVIAVDYRLAPEHPFPAAVDDAYHALRWVAKHGENLGVDAGRIAVAGDSAGGALAAITARKAVKNGMPVLFQALIYPVTDSSLSTDSWEEFADGPVATLSLAQRAWGMYVPDSRERLNPDAAPLLAEDLRKLPPALVLAGEYDPLRDEALAYAGKLRNAGVAVTESLYRGMPHGFFQMGGYIDSGKESIAEVATAINKALRGKKPS